MKTMIAAGIFVWDGYERRSNRYGSFNLVNTNFERNDKAEVTYRMKAIEKLVHHRVRITVLVVTTRTSGHAGDHALHIFPTTPEVGDEIDLGVGVLSMRDTVWSYVSHTIVLQPDDKRSYMWMDPRKLYVLHDQTVEVYAEFTSEPCSPKPDISVATLSDVEAFDNGDGSFQLKGDVKDGEPVRVIPHFESLGDGLFVATMSPGKGRRLKALKMEHK